MIMKYVFAFRKVKNVSKSPWTVGGLAVFTDNDINDFVACSIIAAKT